MSAIRKKAFSLPEALFGLAMSVLISALAYQLLGAFWLVGSDVATRGQLQQVASLAMEKIALDARSSALPGVTVGDGSLALVKLADLDSNGQQIWEQNLVLYFQSGDRLLRRQVFEPGISPGFPLQLSAARLTELARGEGGRCLADCLETLVARLEGAEGPVRTLHVTFRLSRTLRSGRRSQLGLAREFYLRNAP